MSESFPRKFYKKLMLVSLKEQFFFLKFGDILWDRNDKRKAHQEADLE